MVRLLGSLALLVAVILFTGGFVSGRLYYLAGGTTFDVVALRYGPAALLTLPLVLIGFRKFAVHPGWLRAACLALFGGAPFGLCVLTGVAGAPVAHGASIVPAVGLIQGTVIAWVLFREPIGSLRLVGIAITLVGLFVLVIPELNAPDVNWWGDLAYACAGILWGTFTVMLRHWRIKPLEGAAFASVFSLPYLLIYFLFLSDGISQIPWQPTVIHGVYQGVIFSIVAVILYGWGIGRMGPVSAVAAMALSPVFGVTMEWLLLDRPAGLTVFAGVLLITAGVFVTIFGQRPASAASGATRA